VLHHLCCWFRRFVTVIDSAERCQVNQIIYFIDSPDLIMGSINHQSSTRFRFSFVSLLCFLNSLFRSFVTFDTPVRCFRTFGRGHASKSNCLNLSNASFLFCPCVRYSWDVTVNIPPLLILFACCSSNRCRTSPGIHPPELGTCNRTSTLVLTLFTFCPPAPEDRTKAISTPPSGISIVFGTSQGVVVVVVVVEGGGGGTMAVNLRWTGDWTGGRLFPVVYSLDDDTAGGLVLFLTTTSLVERILVRFDWTSLANALFIFGLLFLSTSSSPLLLLLLFLLLLPQGELECCNRKEERRRFCTGGCTVVGPSYIPLLPVPNGDRSNAGTGTILLIIIIILLLLLLLPLLLLLLLIFHAKVVVVVVVVVTIEETLEKRIDDIIAIVKKATMMDVILLLLQLLLLVLLL
jgi:hypothetical protein